MDTNQHFYPVSGRSYFSLSSYRADSGSGHIM